tara:strand:+ start:213 stop:464 length:252 start_codon:yes stop_codon:yes gene_type:complete
MSKLSELKDELQVGVASCISGYVGFLTHPQRERLAGDILQRIADIVDKKVESETYSQQMQKELEPISDYGNSLPRLMKGLEDE